MVDAVAQQVHQGIVEPFDDRLVQLGLCPGRGQFDLLAQFAGQVAHQTPELAEGGAHGQHADTQSRVAKLVGQPLQDLGQVDELRVAFLAHHLGDLGLHDDQFAHQVDQRVQFLGRHPDAGGHLGRGRGLGFLFPQAAYGLLLGQGGFHLFPGNHAALGQDFAQAFALLHDVGQILGMQISAFLEDFTDLLVVGVSVQGLAALNERHLELAVVLHEQEYFLNVLLIRAGIQNGVPPEVALVRVQVLQIGQFVHVHEQFGGSEFAYLVEKGQGIGAQAEDVAVRFEPDSVYGGLARLSGIFPRLLFRDLGSGRGRGLGFLPRGEGLESGDDGGGAFQVRFAARGAYVQQMDDLVPRGQDQIQQFPGDFDAAFPDLVEHGFHLVGERGDVVEPEHGARALDGVHGAEHPVDEVMVLGCVLQFEQGRFQFGQKFLGLFEIRLAASIHVRQLPFWRTTSKKSG